MEEKLKSYISRKQVKAAPMDEATAVEKGYARKNVDGHEWRKGYHVQYTNPDGSTYDSWSPEDVFEESHMIAESVLDRLQIELIELRERCDKIDKLFWKTLPEVIDKIGVMQTSYLLAQRQLMGNYRDILAERIRELKAKEQK